MEDPGQDVHESDLSPTRDVVLGSSTYRCQPDEKKLEYIDLNNGWTVYESKFAKYMPPVSQLRTRAGHIAKRRPYIQKQTVTWWKAQCGLHGLETNGTIEDMQGRIRAHGHDDLRQGLQELAKSWMIQFLSKYDDNKKARALPKQFLQEVFGP